MRNTIIKIKRVPNYFVRTMTRVGCKAACILALSRISLKPIPRIWRLEFSEIRNIPEVNNATGTGKNAFRENEGHLCGIRRMRAL